MGIFSLPLHRGGQLPPAVFAREGCTPPDRKLDGINNVESHSESDRIPLGSEEVIWQWEFVGNVFNTC